MDTTEHDEEHQRRRVGLVAVHTSPLTQPGAGDSGGMNVYLASVARELAAAGLGVDVFTRANGADLPRTLRTDDGVAVHHIEAGPASLGKSDLASHLCAFYIGLATHPATAGLDVLHGHYWMSGWVGRRIRRRLGIPLVQSFHTLAEQKNARLAPRDVPEPALRLAAERRVVGDADAIVAPTAAEHDLLVQRYGAHPGRLHVVEPGVDTDVFHPGGDREAERAALGGGRIILFAGRLQPLKAPDLAVRALAALDRHLDDAGPETRLVIVGGTSGTGAGTTDPPALRRLAAELGVADRVGILAARPQRELAALYRAADAVIMPSYSESFGLVALEAQACGTPVVAADVGGLGHVLDGGGGTLVADHDPDAFAAALAPYLTDPSLRAAAGQAGVRQAQAHSWRRTAAGILAVYRELWAAADTDRARLRGASA